MSKNIYISKNTEELFFDKKNDNEDYEDFIEN